MKIGCFHIAGADAWPDHVLDAQMGGLLFGAVVAGRRMALGAELHGGSGRNPWLSIYVGAWAFELYWDRDRSYDA